jgi:hypothetical protein
MINPRQPLIPLFKSDQHRHYYLLQPRVGHTRTEK